MTVLALCAMQRVMIIGQPGSGKSTLARLMGARSGLPVVHIDTIHWMPGWQERTPAEKGRMCAAVHARDAWIFEGGHSRTWAERLDRADTLIWLDFPLWLRYWRVIRRTLAHYGQTRPDLPENCPERFNWAFMKWIWDTRHSSRNGMQRWYDSVPEGKARFRLGTRAEVSAFLDTL